jgi:hypothetical protein
VIGRLRLDGSIDAAKILVKKLEPGKGHDNSRKPEVAEPDKVKSVPPGQLQHPAQPDKGKGHK